MHGIIIRDDLGGRTIQYKVRPPKSSLIIIPCIQYKVRPPMSSLIIIPCIQYKVRPPKSSLIIMT
jgi:hypothetical protein